MIKKYGDQHSNEIRQLSQGIWDIVGKDALDFVHLSSIPRNKKVAYANMVYIGSDSP